MRRPPGIGQAELEILRYVADHHPITVREVADHLAETKGHTRTTALNMMERLREKGHLDRKKIEGVYHYFPRLPKPDLMRGLVKDFVDRALGGSLQPFVTYLAQDARLNDQELDDLKRLVAELDAQRKEERE